MAIAAQTKMVNGRVGAVAAERAAKVLRRDGLTISSFIRNSLEHIARTGEVPECGKRESGQTASREHLAALVQALEKKPMPGKEDYPGMSEDELVEQLRMERYDC